jgi:hypothetical protein
MTKHDGRNDSGSYPTLKFAGIRWAIWRMFDPSSSRSRRLEHPGDPKNLDSLLVRFVRGRLCGAPYKESLFFLFDNASSPGVYSETVFAT